jgi:hypothetical protein
LTAVDFMTNFCVFVLRLSTAGEQDQGNYYCKNQA